MENTMVDPNKVVLFHPVDTDITNERQKVAEHVGKHYRKYLFGIGALSGFMIAFTAWVLFGTSVTTSTTSAGYESLTPDINAVVVFNEMDAIIHGKDNFFHGTGKIYTLSGDTLFHRYDTMFHVLDNAYHRATSTAEKLKWAQRIEAFIKVQNELFSSTTYVNTEQDKKFETLDKQFLQIIEKINGTGSTQKLTGAQIAQ